MDASVAQHLSEAHNAIEQTSADTYVYEAIKHLISAITIQERNISAMEKKEQ